MNRKHFTILLLFISLGLTVSGQQVSTLISDPTRTFEALHWHEDGRIYAIDYNNGRIYQVFADGKVETLLEGEGFANLAGGGFDNQSNFYFSDIAEGVVYRLNPDTSYTEITSGLNQPVSILNDLQNDSVLFVTEYGSNKVTQVEISTGQQVPLAAGEGINGPDGLIRDWEGNFLVSNFNNSLIHKVDSLGNVSLFARLPDEGFMGYATLSGDFLYVPSLTGRQLFRIDREGEATLIAGTGEQGLEDGPGEVATFLQPNGTCISPSGDTLLVSDGSTIRMVTNLASLVNRERQLVFEQVLISPNPAKDELRVDFSISTPTTLDWKVYDQLGRMVKYGTTKLLSPGTNQLRVSTKDFNPGMYYIQFKNGQNNWSQHPFVKE
ncbi:MAG: T9SS type A sorting domain-containing protein [Bacteroidota bacterium]